MSMISGVQSSAAYLQAVASVTALAPAKDTDATSDASRNSNSSDSSVNPTISAQGLTATRPTDSVGNNVDTFA